MALLFWSWLVLTGVTLVIWSSRHWQLSRAGRTMPPLRSDMFPHDVAPLPAVSFIVAGKDEEENIGACLASMMGQDYPRLQVIAADDRSSDATGAIMDRLAAGSDRLTVIHVTELRAGWLGKNNAMRMAVERADGDWLCFTDADCTQVSSRSLRVAMNYALQEGVDYLSVLPTHDAQTFWEAVVQPACSGILLIWFNPLYVNDPTKKAAYANGAFMLMRRDCYEAIGRHDAVRGEFNEDMHMARLAKAAGRRLRVVSNDDLYTVRMYGTLASTWAGWSRIFYGCFGTLRRLTAAMVAVTIASLLPWITLFASGAVLISDWAARSGAAQGHTPIDASAANWRLLALLSGATCMIQASVMLRFYRLNHAPALYGLLYPIGAVIGLGALANAIRRLRQRATITWRGTTYSANTRIAAPADCA
jgi:cellulose synthase/poly-beta-1,6-N-acetylglucosamine synthase-like glycosyltransferase